jgi:NAD(P)H dehydrogenase (quinone)
MMLPLLHHGMLLVGVPFTEKAIYTTDGGGTPYGASHVARGTDGPRLTAAERDTAQALGRRIARLAVTLARGSTGP